MNRCILLVFGVLALSTGLGCCQTCCNHQQCASWKTGCVADACNEPAAAPRRTRLQHHRPRTQDEIYEDDFVNCEECGRHGRRGRGDCDLCEDCVRTPRRDRRAATRGRRVRRGCTCEQCGGTCAGQCTGSCDGACGSPWGSVPAGSAGQEMGSMGGGYPVYGMPAGAPAAGCSGCAGGATVLPGETMGSMGGPIYQGTIVNSGVMSGPVMEGNSGWYPAQMPAGMLTEPVSAPAGGGVVYSQPGSSAPPPGVFPTPAR